MSGTTGQPDASEPMAGGVYMIEGGFWSVITTAPTPSAPQLTLTLTNPHTIIIHWPSSPTGFVLQERPALEEADWTNYEGQVNDDGIIRSAVIPAGAACWFYRLKK